MNFFTLKNLNIAETLIDEDILSYSSDLSYFSFSANTDSKNLLKHAKLTQISELAING